MPESPQQQSGVITISAGQDVVNTLPDKNSELYVLNTPRGETILFKAEAHSPQVITNFVIVPSSQTAATAMPLSQWIQQGQRQRRPEEQYASTR